MRRYARHIVGLAALALLAALFLLAFYRGRVPEDKTEVKSLGKAAILLEPEELAYRGDGTLDLMEGVSALDEEGNDVTDQVQAVLAGGSDQNEKRIRYTLHLDSGRTLTETRKLHLEDYEGPSIEVQSPLALTAEELPDLIGILQEDGRLRAGDGFGLDITENVTCKRTWLSGEDYTILFRVSNGYGDTAEATVSAVISGEVEHLELELSAISVTIPVGEAFDLYSYILSARDSDGTDRQGDVQVGTVPDTSVPGTYQVAYTLTSSDGMEQVTKYLTVGVR